MCVFKIASGLLHVAYKNPKHRQCILRTGKIHRTFLEVLDECNCYRLQHAIVANPPGLDSPFRRHRTNKFRSATAAPLTRCHLIPAACKVLKIPMRFRTCCHLPPRLSDFLDGITDAYENVGCSILAWKVPTIWDGLAASSLR